MLLRRKTISGGTALVLFKVTEVETNRKFSFERKHHEHSRTNAKYC